MNKLIVSLVLVAAAFLGIVGGTVFAQTDTPSPRPSATPRATATPAGAPRTGFAR